MNDLKQEERKNKTAVSSLQFLTLLKQLEDTRTNEEILKDEVSPLPKEHQEAIDSKVIRDFKPNLIRIGPTL